MSNQLLYFFQPQNTLFPEHKKHCQLLIDRPHPWGHWVKCNWQAWHSVTQLTGFTTVVWCILLLKLMSVPAVSLGVYNVILSLQEVRVQKNCSAAILTRESPPNLSLTVWWTNDAGRVTKSNLVSSRAPLERCWHLIGTVSDLYFHHTGLFCNLICTVPTCLLCSLWKLWYGSAACWLTALPCMEPDFSSGGYQDAITLPVSICVMTLGPRASVNQHSLRVWTHVAEDLWWGLCANISALKAEVLRNVAFVSDTSEQASLSV